MRRRLLLAVSFVAAIVAAYVVYQAVTWPDVAALADNDPETASTVEHYRRRGETVDWRWVPYGSISDSVKQAVVVAEDIDFFSHNGFSEEEIRKAIDDALEGKRLRGASTITQQLAKNLWLSNDRSFARKAKEALLTRQLEKHLSKRRILELYLNVVEFVPGRVGIEAAARHSFGRSAAALNPDQAAALAASLPASTWHPGSDSSRYRAHRDRVRGRMRQAQWVLKEV